MATSKKTPIKKEAPKKAAAKKEKTVKEKTVKVADTTEKTVKEPKTFSWTKAKKQTAHDLLLKQYNAKEPNRKNKLVINYLPDGTAVTVTTSILKKFYTLKME